MSLNLSLLMEALARPPKVFHPPRDIADAEGRTLRLLMRESNFRAAGSALAAALTF